jgi:hypothetical protein
MPFCRKVDDLLIWSERLLAKSSRFGFKDVMLEKKFIITVDEDIDEGYQSGKKKSVITKLN